MRLIDADALVNYLEEVIKKQNGKSVDLVPIGELLTFIAREPTINDWIPVRERLPEERDSMFAKFKGTSKWKKGMFEKVSRNVIVTVKYDNGECRTNVAHTVDGRWKLEIRILNAEVIAWKEMPEPYKEDKNVCCFQKGLTVYGYACGIAKTMNKDTHSRPDWCPLRPLPEKMKLAGKYDQEYFQKGGKMPSYKCGWNDCLDKITGGE